MWSTTLPLFKVPGQATFSPRLISELQMFRYTLYPPWEQAGRMATLKGVTEAFLDLNRADRKRAQHQYKPENVQVEVESGFLVSIPTGRKAARSGL
jgi:hypothetical protein